MHFAIDQNMETTNLLGISDQLMVQRVYAEKPNGGATTLAVYNLYSSFGFSRLRKSSKFLALSDLERQEAAYNASMYFIKAILEGQYVPHEKSSSVAYYWTICKRRAFGVLRKLASGEKKGELDMGDELQSGSFAPAAFIYRTSLDDPDNTLPPGETEKITVWLDAQLVWDTIRRGLGNPCYNILMETVKKDRPHEEAARKLGYTLKALKVMKSRCRQQLRDLLRGEL